uniref:DSBA-like thioredoxin domain-containing protein n=1 Tax=Sinocyclocheilus grahami TaxID=75366 RepID=A0A672LEC1_SINGR
MFSSGKVVELFYDVVSPYSWLAFEMLCRYRNVWNIDLKFKPAYLAGVIYGSVSLYIVSDLTLLSEYYGVPMFRPSDLYDKDTLNAMRFVTAVAEKEKEGGVLWRTHQDITQPASLTEHKVSAFCLHLCTLCLSHQNVFVLKKYHKMSLHISSPFLQCFGFPFIVCHVNGKVKVFFASDRFELMAYFIGNYN